MGCACVEAVGAALDMELCGTSGRGDELGAALAVSAPEVAVEFTAPDAAEDHLRTMLEAGVHVVSGTTGLAPEAPRGRSASSPSARGIGLLLAPNFAVGVLLSAAFRPPSGGPLHRRRAHRAPPRRQARRALGHRAGHRAANRRGGGRTAELPTAPMRSNFMPGCRGGSAVPACPCTPCVCPGYLAHQEVLFGARGQLLTLRHDTLDRAAFMPGVLARNTTDPGAHRLGRLPRALPPPAEPARPEPTRAELRRLISVLASPGGSRRR